MNETVLSDLPARPYLTLTTICGVGSLMIPILQTKNPKLREVKLFPQHHTAGQCRIKLYPHLWGTERRELNLMLARAVSPTGFRREQKTLLSSLE